MAKQSTSTQSSSTRTTKDYRAAFKRLGYTFRRNAVTDLTEVNGEPLSDGLAAKIRCAMIDVGCSRIEFIDQVIAATAYENTYHPINEYLIMLSYDGGDHIANLATHFVNPDNLFHLALRKFLIGACAKAVEGAQNPMLVLTGPQGKGKSQFARWLVPSGLPGYFIESPIRTGEKDTLLRLAGKWIWEVAELGSTTRTQDLEELKFFLTMGEVTVRRAYGRYDTIKRALASFIGTVNGENAILNDQTGSRRFRICQIEDIDWEYTKIDINQIWAEAFSAYLAGEDWNLTPDQQNVFNENNKIHTVDDPVQVAIENAYSIDASKVNDPAWFEPTAGVIQALRDFGNKMNDRALQMEISRVCSRLGLKKIRKGVMGYYGLHSKKLIP